MTELTPATSTDNALGAEGDTDQLSGDDTLLDRGVEDLLDEGYSPPDRDRPTHYGETAWEQKHRETIDQRARQEEPDVWDSAPRQLDEDRAGRLVEDDDAVDAGGTDTFAVEAGLAGGAASAEEAAVHLVAEDDVR